jgi:hypothetical protein
MAAEIHELDVTREDGHILVRSSLTIDAPLSDVYRALSDYDQFAELSTRFIESRFVEPAADGPASVYTVLEGCVWFFCRSVKRTAQLELTPDERIVATAEPESSDVKYGVEVWELTAVEGATLVEYQHDMDPDFWVPPVLGLWAIKRALENDSLAAAQRIEKLALTDHDSKND